MIPFRKTPRPSLHHVAPLPLPFRLQLSQFLIQHAPPPPPPRSPPASYDKGGTVLRMANAWLTEGVTNPAPGAAPSRFMDGLRFYLLTKQYHPQLHLRFAAHQNKKSSEKAIHPVAFPPSPRRYQPASFNDMWTTMNAPFPFDPNFSSKMTKCVLAVFPPLLPPPFICCIVCCPLCYNYRRQLDNISWVPSRVCVVYFRQQNHSVSQTLHSRHL